MSSLDARAESHRRISSDFYFGRRAARRLLKIWVPVVVAGAGAVALARPEVRAGRALAALGRGVVIGAFPA